MIWLSITMKKRPNSYSEKNRHIATGTVKHRILYIYYIAYETDRISLYIQIEGKHFKEKNTSKLWHFKRYSKCYINTGY